MNKFNRGKVNKKYLFISILSAFFVALGIFLLLASIWANSNFNNLSPEQIIYNLTQPMEGADSNFINSFITGPLFIGILLLVVLVAIFYLPMEKHTNSRFGKRAFISSLLVFVLTTSVAAYNINAVAFYKYLTSDSNYIQRNYVEPKESLLTFPKKKRNLIYIYGESLESTATSKSMGGQDSQNMLPNLTKLANQGIHFSDSDKEFGGAQQLEGTGYTIAGMVAQTSGMPLKVPSGLKTKGSYANGQDDKFLPGITSINDILAKNGYNQTFLLGSDATFGGRRNYFSQHCDVFIDDYKNAKKTNRIPNNYKVWWGYEDSKLFDYAKVDLNYLSQQNKPFNLTMLTVNTHHIGGYKEKSMPSSYSKYGDKYSQVIAYSDYQIAEFIKWAQTQPWYENTTIIVDGDHLGMDTSYYKGVTNRHTFNMILNAPSDQTKNVKTKDRQFSTMDMFPTTLASLGVKINGNRLGMGANLLSDRKTLIEQDGFDKVNTGLSTKSSFYDKKFIEGK
ncbi:sulfatase-like hydrolase/transferase [Lactobacillus terrae]|uniref:sulfatase-like hydrolase/transferase n=1 Tax=Lactobacillus terrae TaxID=2269374 RepID=UPI000C1B61C3|nr:sulfatase-like hydrolase/transferase [Lactobacillus terrae]